MEPLNPEDLSIDRTGLPVNLKQPVTDYRTYLVQIHGFNVWVRSAFDVLRLLELHAASQ